MPLSEQEREELLKKIEEQRKVILQKTFNPYRLRNTGEKKTKDKDLHLTDNSNAPSESATTIGQIDDKVELANVKRKKKLNIKLSNGVGSISQLRWSLVVVVLLGSIAIIIIGIIVGYIVSRLGLPKVK